MRRRSALVSVWAGVLAGLFLSAGAQAQEGQPQTNLLTLAKGAVLVSASAEPHLAMALTDGDLTSNWNSSTRRNPPPYTFVFELLAPAQLTAVGIDGAGERPGGVAGGSAGPVLIEASPVGPDSGFVELATIMAAPDGATMADVDPAGPVRWLRFTVMGGQGETSWVYFDEVIAYGTLTPPDAPDRFTGVFQSGRANFIELQQDGVSVVGCYLESSGRSGGTISGAVQEGVALVGWKSDQGITGTAFLTIDASGALFGVRYRDRSRTTWGGPVAPEGTTTPCSPAPQAAASPEPEVNPIIQTLLDDGEVVIYGILFESNSDVPKASSGPALNTLLAALQSAPDMQVTIEGHTDADGSDAFNLDLSDRRAASVMGWLVKAGVSATRLQSAGKGESEPVASNVSADGKALNRRVEVRLR